MRTVARIAIAFAAVAVVTAAVVTVSAQPKDEPPKSGEQRFEVKLTDEMIRHSRIRDTLYFVGTAWTVATLLLLLLTPASRKMRDAAARVTRRPFLIAMLYIAMFILAMAVLDFPL